ncbi:hypothetical protein HGM15179_008576 [Zosterops borbonicus]|uniref:Uncharacterized protein n=1 Tax=Zosterops borbonicus TaxID=364589 RepID=A0A8K1GII8_9PASS|nr:hypothetical protein HGM15179_008576 [Zosterops borbonicus]
MRMVLQQPPQIKSDDKELCWGTENVWVHLAFTYMQTLDSENLWTPSKNLKAVTLLAQLRASGKSREEPDPTGDPGDT